MRGEGSNGALRIVRAAGALGGGEGLVLEIRCGSGGIMVKMRTTRCGGRGRTAGMFASSRGLPESFSGGLRPRWTRRCGPGKSVGCARGRGVRRRPDRERSG